MSHAKIVSRLSAELVAIARKFGPTGADESLKTWTPETLLESLSVGLDIPYLKITPEDVDRVAYDRFKAKCSHLRFVPLFQRAILIVVATPEPWNDAFLRAARKELQMEVRVIGTTEKDLDRTLALLENTEAIPSGEPELEVYESHRPRESWLLPSGNDYNALVREIIGEAYRRGASDIHMDPMENRFGVRFRIMGELEQMPPIEPHLREYVGDAVKSLAQIPNEEGVHFGSGKIQQDIGGPAKLDLRVETQRTPHGIAVVMRLLDPTSISKHMGTLPFKGRNLEMANHCLGLENGMIIMTGPTGSGKTTTLYRMLTSMDIHGRVIRTIEHPIEYSLDGVNQVQAPTKKDENGQFAPDFAAVLRSHLRADPEVILVGEIRDKDTASTAVQAALTGHLILSTLHTNNAPGAIPRLLDLGITPHLLQLTTRLVVAQRLVTKLCPICKIEEEATDKIKRHFAFHKMPIPDRVFRRCGCGKCNHTGLIGRLPLFEFLMFNDDVAAIMKSGADEKEFTRRWRERGGRTLAEDCLDLILDGSTSYDQVQDLDAEFFE